MYGDIKNICLMSKKITVANPTGTGLVYNGPCYLFKIMPGKPVSSTDPIKADDSMDGLGIVKAMVYSSYWYSDKVDYAFVLVLVFDLPIYFSQGLYITFPEGLNLASVHYIKEADL